MYLTLFFSLLFTLSEYGHSKASWYRLRALPQEQYSRKQLFESETCIHVYPYRVLKRFVTYCVRDSHQTAVLSACRVVCLLLEQKLAKTCARAPAL